jgi:hypothetical protein
VSISGFDTGYFTSIAWHDDHYAIVSMTDELRVGFATIDMTGRLIDGVTWIADYSQDPHLTWSDEAEAWVVGWASASDGPWNIFIAFIDDAALLLSDPVPVGMDSHHGGPRVTNLKSMITVVWPHGDGIWFTSFQWPDVEDALPASLIMPASLVSDSAIEAVGFHDYTLVVMMDGHDVKTIVLEPLWGHVVAGPEVIGHSGLRDRRPGIAAAHERGYLGVCYETGPGPSGGSEEEDGIAFRIISPYGEALGAELEIVSGLRNAGGCAVAWSGEEFMVIYWSCAGDAVWNTIYAQRVRPLI